MAQLTVKPTSNPTLPSSYTRTTSSGDTVTKNIGAGLAGKEFDQRITEHGDTWVMVNGLVVLAPTESHLGQVGGTTVLSTAGFVRPANTTTYTAGDAVNDSATSPTPLVFPNVVRRTGGTGVLLNVELIDLAYTVALLGSFELYIYDSIPSLAGDNLACAMSNADVSRLIHVVPFSATPYATNAGAGAAGNCVYTADPINRAFVCVGGTSIWGQLVVRNAYVPVSSEAFVIRLTCLQD